MWKKCSVPVPLLSAYPMNLLAILCTPWIGFAPHLFLMISDCTREGYSDLNAIWCSLNADIHLQHFSHECDWPFCSVWTTVKGYRCLLIASWLKNWAYLLSCLRHKVDELHPSAVNWCLIEESGIKQRNHPREKVSRLQLNKCRVFWRGYQQNIYNFQLGI